MTRIGILTEAYSGDSPAMWFYANGQIPITDDYIADQANRFRDMTKEVFEEWLIAYGYEPVSASEMIWECLDHIERFSFGANNGTLETIAVTKTVWDNS